MDPEARDFVQFIKGHPKEAEILALKWQEFVKKYPEVASFETAGEFYAWAVKHPEVDRGLLQEILDGKKVQDTYFLLRALPPLLCPFFFCPLFV